jgi:hypothetical protein
MRRAWCISGLSVVVLAAACFRPDRPIPTDPGPGGAGGDGGGGGSAGGGGDLLAGADCDPLVPTHCGYPFPSDVWTVADPDSPTGKRVRFGATTLPFHDGIGAHLDPALVADHDGFSINQAPMTHMPGATVTGLASVDDIGRSLDPESPTVLLDTTTGEPVPHFAELDVTSDDDADRALMIRPVVRLRDGTRYVVAIRHVVDEGGNELAPGDVFLALRDGTAHDEPSVGARRAHYAAIFDDLEDAGYPTDDLQIAWDFTTASLEHKTRAMLHVRDAALAAVGADGPEYVIDTIEPDPNPDIAFRIRGRMTVPQFVDSPDPGAKLVLGEDGLPMQNGTAEYAFVVHVPHSAVAAPAALLQNGHGLLGSMNEGQNGYLARIANEKHFVAFSVDLVGWSDPDTATILQAINEDFGKFRDVIDRAHQGFVNELLAMRMMKGRFWQDPAVQFNGQSAIDPAEAYYRGDSQGGIYGATYMALTTDVGRGLLGEPGCPYNLLLNRSVDFEPFFVFLTAHFGEQLDVQLVLAIAQMLWDRIDPCTYLPHVTDDPFPGTPQHQVLLHVAIGDYQVTPLGAHLMARELHATHLTPANRSLWGLEELPAPFVGNALVEFRFPRVPEEPKLNVPPDGPEDMDPHDWVRVLDASIDQTDVFLRTGVVQQTCAAACDPE